MPEFVSRQLVPAAVAAALVLGLGGCGRMQTVPVSHPETVPRVVTPGDIVTVTTTTGEVFRLTVDRVTPSALYGLRPSPNPAAPFDRVVVPFAQVAHLELPRPPNAALDRAIGEGLGRALAPVIVVVVAGMLIYFVAKKGYEYATGRSTVDAGKAGRATGSPLPAGGLALPTTTPPPRPLPAAGTP